MSSILIHDLAHSAALDCAAMRSLRGGTGWGSPSINVHVPINISQANHLVQTTNVLNNSVIGPGASLPGLKIAPMQWGINSLALSARPV